MAAETSGVDLLPAIALLGAGVVAVPLFKRAGLGAVVGYLAAGIAIGPFGLRLFTEPASILSVAQLGVVMLLFVIGLELKPSRLWALRRDIFGLGVAQVVVSGIVLAAAGLAVGARFRRRADRGDGPGALLDRHRHADPRGTRRNDRAARPQDLRGPAPPGSRDRPVPRHRRASLAGPRGGDGFAGDQDRPRRLAPSPA